MTMPGGVDISSHEDMFNAVFAKVCVWVYTGHVQEFDS